MKIRSLFQLSVIASIAGTCASQAAVLIPFDDNASYDNNFAETFVGGGATTRDSGGFLLRVPGTNSSTGVIYNTTATGGAGGNGGTALGSPLDNTFGGSSVTTLQMDFLQASVSGLGSNSFGFYAKVNDVANSGYTGVFRIGSGSADFRMFDGGNPTTGTAGTQFGTTQTFTGTFSTSTYYTLRLDFQDVGSDVAFTGSIWNQGGSVIHTFPTITDTTSAVLGAGQVGFRVNSAVAGGSTGGNIQLDNFSIIPEPSSALLGGLGTLLLFRRRRG